MTLKDDILQAIRAQPGLTDADIVRLVPGGRSRHQQVNHRCRSLAQEGLVHREKHDGSPIRNYPRGDTRTDGLTPNTAPTSTPALRKSAAISSHEAISHEEVAVGLRWHFAGAVTLTSDCRLVFPKLGSVPGLYRFRFAERRAIYVGESNQLSRRMQNYRNPSPSQSTSTWVNLELTRSLTAGELVLIETCTDIVMRNRNGTIPADLQSKAIRLIAENAAIVDEMQGEWTLLNKAMQ